MLGSADGNMFVGRAEERATIDALLGDAKRGQSGALLFTGPPPTPTSRGSSAATGEGTRGETGRSAVMVSMEAAAEAVS